MHRQTSSSLRTLRRLDHRAEIALPESARRATSHEANVGALNVRKVIVRKVIVRRENAHLAKGSRAVKCVRAKADPARRAGKDSAPSARSSKHSTRTRMARSTPTNLRKPRSRSRNSTKMATEKSPKKNFVRCVHNVDPTPRKVGRKPDRKVVVRDARREDPMAPLNVVAENLAENLAVSNALSVLSLRNSGS